MKRVILFILASILILTACQKTPEAEIVVQKDTDVMIEKAQATPGAATKRIELREELEAPHRLEKKTVLADGRLHLVFSADVIIPKCDGMSVYRAAPAEFTQQQAQRYVKVLFGEAALYQQRSEPTKKELMEQIVTLEYLKEQELNADEETQASLESAIAVLQEAIKSAPDTIEFVPFDGTFKTEYILDDNGRHQGSYPALRADAEDENDSRTIEIRNNDNLKAGVIDADGMGGRPPRRGAMLNYLTWDALRNYKYLYSDLTPTGEGFVLPEGAKASLTLTPEEAKIQVDALLADMGIDCMSWVSTMLTDDEAKGNYDGIVHGAEHYAYRLDYVRTIDGIPTALLGGSARDAGNAFLVNGTWHYEYLTAIVDDTGVFQLEWMSPHEITETVVSSCALLPFAKIMEIADKMLAIQYEHAARQYAKGEAKEVCIDKLELCYIRIREQNTIENGLFVPAWMFYATDIDYRANGDVYDNNGGYFMGCPLAINAIDGSIIDVELGY